MNDEKTDFNRSTYDKLDLSKLNFSDETISTEEALKDVCPIEWSPDILDGKRKAIIKK